jgi:hypothetical protein
MSVMYFLHVDLDAQYTEKNVNHILKNFSEQGCIFLAKEEDKDLTAVGSYFLTPEQASTKIVAATDEAREAYEDTLLIKCKDTYCDLRFYRDDNGLLSISLFGFSCPWSKNFWYGKEDFVIDFARYINLGIDITKNFSLLGLEMSSDHSGEWPEDLENCVVAVIEMGDLKELFSGSVEGVRGSLNCIITNVKENSITFFDENTGQKIEPSAQKYYEIFKVGFPVYLYAKKDDVTFKVEIKRMEQGCDFVSVYPLEPYRMKKGYASEGEKIDVAFYVQRLLELCENFAIYELKTFF